MKYSVIDIGSNSMRLTVYKVKNGSFKILFKDKRMAGLAGYVEKGCISDRGIKLSLIHIYKADRGPKEDKSAAGMDRTCECG